MTFPRFAAPLALTAALLTGGCAAPTLYQWGSYDTLLYESYKYPDKVAVLRQGLETQVAAVEVAKQRVAPGLYAEIGTLYLQSGDSNKAVLYYTKERDSWPESRTLMDALIKNADKRPAASSPSSQAKP
jgi:hypothetical protein